MRELVEEVFAAPSASTKEYLSLIRFPHGDKEARLSAVRSADDDLGRWFTVVMASALKPGAAIHGRSSLIPKILEAGGLTRADAEAVLLGDPLADLARTLGLSFVADQLKEAQMRGWLSLDRISALLARLSQADPAKLALAGTQAADGNWAEDDVKVRTTQLLDDAKGVLAYAEAGKCPLRVVFDF